jgi:hypothetical protein
MKQFKEACSLETPDQVATRMRIIKSRTSKK